ncbi:MAG: hypothetical protein AAFR87_13145 [Bacteroidota bacterium]
MQYQEISLNELITYLEGSASDTVKQQIEDQRQNNPDFADEFEEWEAFLEEAESREAGIEKMKAFREEWHTTELDTFVVETEAKVVQFDTRPASEEKKAYSRNLYFRIAIAACILLIAGVIINNLLQGPNLSDQVQNSFAQELNLMLSNKARAMSGSEKEKFDVYLSSLLQAKQYDRVLTSLDSLLSESPEESSYQLVQALTFSQAGDDQAAEKILIGLSSESKQADAFQCKVLKNLALLQIKQENKVGYENSLQKIKAENEAGYSCNDLDNSLLKSLEPLGKEL